MDLGMAAHTDMAATAVILQPGIDALDVRAFVVTLVRRVDVAAAALRPGLARQFLLVVLVPGMMSMIGTWPSR